MPTPFRARPATLDLLAIATGAVAGLGAVAFDYGSSAMVRLGLVGGAGYVPAGPRGEEHLFDGPAAGTVALVSWLLLVRVLHRQAAGTAAAEGRARRGSAVTAGAVPRIFGFGCDRGPDRATLPELEQGTWKSVWHLFGSPLRSVFRRHGARVRPQVRSPGRGPDTGLSLGGTRDEEQGG